MTRDQLRAKANELPLLPGVYLMMDKTGQVIYVGKAKKLKNRVSQYFQDTASHNEKTKMMVAHVDRFDTIIVRSEFEALVLENSLIKRHQPRYNILLKDDKGYPFVRLDSGDYPHFTLVNRTADDGAKYYGPFGGRHETRLALDAVCAALRLPTCSRRFPRDIGKERPCLNFHMGHHHLRFLVVAGGVLKVLADAVFQFFGLAHIDDLSGFVHHQIDAGQQGQVVGLGAELITGHGVISFHGKLQIRG